MAYQALLFCPDEKTARTVTQVLSELDFAVIPCTEPFAAVKKLMAEHFDAVVVDCDNEQNATLLFKSAHNSPNNHSSLAVAVVEGQAGVAKAFRIGANLVLTKPINVEQAKGTLRVARGLLRKGEAAKAAAAPASAPTAANATAPGPAKPGPQAVNPSKPRAVVPMVPPTAVNPKSQPVVTALDSTIFSEDDADVAEETHALEPPVIQAAAKSAPSAAPVVASARIERAPEGASSPARAGGAIVSSSGAASAPARAREPQEKVPEKTISISAPASPEVSTGHTAEVEKTPSPSGEAAPLPSFTFGGNAAEAPRSGSKKPLLAVAAAVVAILGAYGAWTQFQGKSSAPEQTVAQPAVHPAPAPASVPASVTPGSSSASSLSSALTQPTATGSAPAPVSVKPSPSGTSPVEAKPAAGEDFDSDRTGSSQSGSSLVNSSAATSNSGKTSHSPAAPTGKSATAEKATPQTIIVKSNSASSPGSKAESADVPAPSPLAMATPGSGGSLPNLIAGSGSAPRPVLQTVNVSQGVSQGLIYKKVQPTYPPSALRMRVEGSVELMATISKHGDITAVKILNGTPLLAHAAADAVKQWKYKPYLLNGEPVEIQTQITVNFKLPK